MAISFECEACGKSFMARDKMSGKTGQCEQCGSRLVIPLKPGSEPSRLDAPAGEAAPEPEPLPPRPPRPGPAPKAPLWKPKQKAKSGNRPHGPEGDHSDAALEAVGIGLVIILFVFRMILNQK